MSVPSGSSPETAPVISPTLLALLVCPLDKAPLELVGATLVCTNCHRVYPIENGVPNMLVERDE